MKRLRVLDRIMTSHDSCTSGISRVLTVASLQRLRMETLIPAPADCEVRSVIKFLNSQSIAPIGIHRQLRQQSFPQIYCSLLHKCITEQLLFRKLCARWVPKQLTPDHKAKRKESALIIVIHLFLYLKKFLSGHRSVFRITERRR